MEITIRIFFSYAHEDELLRQGLEKQLRSLRRQGLIDLWHDRDISAGTEWEREINEHLNTAHIILLLVSPDFMDSEYSYSIEMTRAMERHEQGETRVIPIILRPVYFKGAPFAKLLVLPTDGRPITSPDWHDLDAAFFDVAEGIRKTVEELRKQALTDATRISSHRPPATKKDLQGKDLHGADLVKADLCEANLIRADLHGADLHGADLYKADLYRADLTGANLYGANLSKANLTRANFTGANLTKANLTEADLYGADLYKAELYRANLTGANLTRVNFTGADLTEANFTKADVLLAIFGNSDLRQVKGLETMGHDGPSTIGIDTIYRSQGEIPQTFLRGAGIPETFIDYMPSLVGSVKAIEYYTCFLSYSSQDQDFVSRLHADLQTKGVRSWFAPEDLSIGDKIRHRIEESIRLYDKLIVVLSQYSISSEWVEYEVERGMQKEPIGVRNVLYPIRLDDAIMQESSSWVTELRATRHIGDFTRWKEHDAYMQAFDQLLYALSAKPTKRGME